MQYAQQLSELFERHNLLQGTVYQAIYLGGAGTTLLVPLSGHLSEEEAGKDNLIAAFKAARITKGFGWGISPDPVPGMLKSSTPMWEPGHPAIVIGEKQMDPD